MLQNVCDAKMMRTFEPIEISTYIFQFLNVKHQYYESSEALIYFKNKNNFLFVSILVELPLGINIKIIS